MFVAQAHSFTQQARLAITLAWVAGYTNILSILTCGHAISHATGSTTDLGRSVAQGNWTAAAFGLFILVTFTIGAMISGLATETGRRRAWESIYVLPMVLECLFLIAFAIGVDLHESGVPETGPTLYFMIGTASAAMGLQNATITRISSGVVRTTHVTGVLTDLGVEIVHFFSFVFDRRSQLRGGLVFVRELQRAATTRRLALLASVIGSFALGAALGTAAYDYAQRLAMFPPVLFLLWCVAQDLRVPIAEIEASELVGDDALQLPSGLVLFHLRRDPVRRGPTQRLPDLMAWIDRLPATARVVILDMEQVTQLESNSAQELRAALRRMRSQHRHLLLAGVTPRHYRELQAAGTGDAESIDLHAVCPDVELAIARGYNLLLRPDASILSP